jgi:hypothetical protein
MFWFLLRCQSGYAMPTCMKTTGCIWLVRLTLPMLLVACAPSTRSDDVWNTYDVRHPVSGNVPDYQAYPVDNDAYYKAPDCTIMDSPSCGE